MATIPVIGEAIRDAIETHAADLPAACTVARSYLPRYKLAELTAIVVTVKPAGFRIDRLTRSQLMTDPVFEVAMQKHVGDNFTNDTLDPLMEFAEQLAALLFHRVSEAAAAKLVSVEPNDPTPIDTLLNDHNVWAAVLRATYKRKG